MGNQTDRVEPPPLSPRQSELEARLAGRAHASVRKLAWWERTQALARVWDLLRRRRLGLLHTAIPAFTPLWEHHFWSHFNKGRQQADLLGASYEDYVGIQINRSLRGSFDELDPADLHGREALSAYRAAKETCDEFSCRMPTKPPFDAQSYNPDDPLHRAYVQGKLREMLDLAGYICSDGKTTPEDVLASAVCQAALPLKALSLAPELREKIERLVGGARRSAAGAAEPDHKIII